MIDMEKKQLNLSAPLLSARRYSSPLRSCGEEVRAEAALNSFPANRSKLLGEVAKPGTVPFTWEQIPGRAKSSQINAPEYGEPPRLPPGRAMDGVKSGELRFLRPNNKLSGELWQPARFLSGELPLLRAQNRSATFPPVHDMKNSAQFNKFMNHNKVSSDSGSDTDEEATFSDALDALESYSMNCSTSGLSSLEFPVAKTCTYTSSTDVGNRDFMMNRFLPAAKAMTLESPQYASKRQTALAVEPPHLSKIIVPKIVKTVPEKDMAMTLYTGRDIGPQRCKDEEESELGWDEPRSISIKACRFFPWFCSRNALRLFNPVPAMKVKTKSALASASKVGRLVKNASFKSPGRTNSKAADHKNKVGHITKSCELNRVVESKPSNNNRSRPMFYSGELPTRNGTSQPRNGGLSPYRNYKRSSVSPLRSESPHSAFHNSASYPIVPKRVDDHKNSKASDRAPNMSGPLSYLHQRKFPGSCPGSPPVAERTFHLDSVNIARGRQNSGRVDIMKARGAIRGAANSQRSSIECQADDILSKMTRQSNSSRGRELVVVRAEDAGPLPPPLPKSPSESWLSRNLNAVSPRNSVSNTKWETIVRSNHLRCDHGRYSEELVARQRK